MYTVWYVGLAISDKKIIPAEDGIDGTIGLFQWNSGCSAEQKTLRIPFQTVPQRRKMLGILFRGKKIEANSRNSVPKHVLDRNMLSFLFAGAGFFVKLFKNICFEAK
jgi:hypothetical protein